MMGISSQAKLDALRSAIYHSARRSALETTNRLFNFAVIISGTSAVAGFSSGTFSPKIFALIATIAGTLQLVFDFGGRAKEHQFLQVRFYKILQFIEAELCPDATQVAKWSSDLIAIYADEPPTMYALNAVAYNSAADAMNAPYRLKVSWIQSLLRHIYPFNGTKFAYVAPAAVPSEKN